MRGGLAPGACVMLQTKSSARGTCESPPYRIVHTRPCNNGCQPSVDLGASILFAAHVANNVGKTQRECGGNEEQPVETQPEERADSKKEPHNGGQDETKPEDTNIERRTLQVILLRLKFPFCRAVVAHLTPPAQSHHQSACHILDGPEVKGKEKHAQHKNIDEARGEPCSKDVRKEGQRLETEVEEGGDRVLQPRGDIRCS
mmetsp:Transcript_4557/g.10332  ORF Transcript_4557/g.10332 Transcript_4557/m.10332 type:complete len:201 (-) Transcript_4557:245-847(-)